MDSSSSSSSFDDESNEAQHCPYRSRSRNIFEIIDGAYASRLEKTYALAAAKGESWSNSDSSETSSSLTSVSEPEEVFDCGQFAMQYIDLPHESYSRNAKKQIISKSLLFMISFIVVLLGFVAYWFFFSRSQAKKKTSTTLLLLKWLSDIISIIW